MQFACDQSISGSLLAHQFREGDSQRILSAAYKNRTFFMKPVRLLRKQGRTGPPFSSITKMEKCLFLFLA